MRKSIIQPESERKCFLCGCTRNLETHHTWHGTANRRLADEDGLTVLLCDFCHDHLHDKNNRDKYLMQIGEKAWIDKYNGSIESFRERYGSNVL